MNSARYEDLKNSTAYAIIYHDQVLSFEYLNIMFVEKIFNFIG